MGVNTVKNVMIPSYLLNPSITITTLYYFMIYFTSLYAVSSEYSQERLPFMPLSLRLLNAVGRVPLHLEFVTEIAF